MLILGIVSSSSREVPNAPTIGTATDVGTNRAYNNGAATVTFTAPTFNGGLPITSYLVTSSPGGFTTSGASSPLTVTGLQSSVSYTFTVTATNAIGTSAPSGATASITATTVPQAPTIGTATAGNASATVAYTANATGGKAVSTYMATSTPFNFIGTGASPITVSGLSNGTAYFFKVKATNANGTSLESNQSNVVTPFLPSSFESIATVTAAGSETSATFSSIPSSYKSLQLRINMRDTASNDVYLQLNGNTGTNYAWHRLRGINSTVTAGGSSSTDKMFLGFGNNDLNTSGVFIVDFIDYASTTKNKTVRGFSGLDDNGAGNSQVILTSGLWMSTSSVTSLSVVTFAGGTFRPGSTIALYGIK